jgi:hypothetical protein
MISTSGQTSLMRVKFWTIEINVDILDFAWPDWLLGGFHDTLCLVACG